jgi:hypothetical protein
VEVSIDRVKLKEYTTDSIQKTYSPKSPRQSRARTLTSHSWKAKSPAYFSTSYAPKQRSSQWSSGTLSHFRSLSRLARGFGLSSHRPEQDWREVFDTVFTELIEAILHYRLQILATGCEHAYTWPNTAGAYDIRHMEIHGAKMKLPLQILLTVFPGLKVKPPGSDSMRTYE